MQPDSIRRRFALTVPAAWSSGTAYKAGDLAIRGNTTFICNVGHSNHDPFTDCATVLAGTYWTFFSLRGGLQNYVQTAEPVTTTGSYDNPTTTDAATVFSPNGFLRFQFSAQWKLSGSSLAASLAQIQVDDATITGMTANNASSTTESGVSLGATGTFWGILASSTALSTGMLIASASTTTDAAAPTIPYVGAASGSSLGFQSIFVGVGVHKVGVKYQAGNGTTTVNVRERRLEVWGE